MTPDFESIATLANCPTLHGEAPLPSATLKHEPEDFVVAEIPAYELSGTGEHLFLWMQKRDISAEQFKKHIVRTLDIPGREIGIAGNKDRRAVTRQFVSVPMVCENQIAELETPAIQVLDVKRHTNKLRTGHLKGNQFELLLRGSFGPEQIESCTERMRLLSDRGFANYFGTQRFGGGETPKLGWELLTGRLSRRLMTKQYGRSLFRLCLSAVQSMLFNMVLAQRIADESVDAVHAGDVAMFRDRRTHFLVTDAATDQQRLNAGELVLTGPIPGRKMTTPEGDIAKLEQEILQSIGLPDDAFNRYPKLTVGTRRRLLQWPVDLVWEFTGDGLKVQFTLPPGTYATVLLREIAGQLIPPTL